MRKILVNSTNLEGALRSLLNADTISFDTETYGLSYSHRAFSFQLTVKGGDAYYFNCNPNSSLLTGDIYSQTYIMHELKDVFSNPNKLWIIANAKFDMHRLDREGVRIAGDIWDTLLVERILYNRHMSYSLDNSLKRIGHAKNDQVKKWLDEKRCYTLVDVEGRDKPDKNYHYNKVPLELMVDYGLDDTIDNLKLYEHQLNLLQTVAKDQMKLVKSNMRLVKAVFEMEVQGIKVDSDYIERQINIWSDKSMEYANEITSLTGKAFDNGKLWLEDTLKEQGLDLQYSEKGNAMLDKKALGNLNNAVAENVVLMRDAQKRCSQYQGINRFIEPGSIVHPNYRLGGTDTFRFSCSDPNLQNVEACEKGAIHTVRSAFIPSNQEEVLVSIDYRAMEYRLVADIAGEIDWIEAINNGVDPHSWVASIMGTDRTAAKTLNFMLLYGGGIAKLASVLFQCMTNERVLRAICNIYFYNFAVKDPEDLLLVSNLDPATIEHEMEQLRKANDLKKIYTKALPKVQRFIKEVKEVALSRGYVTNQFGMRYYLDNPKFAYRIPNHLIQGTGGCTIRDAIPDVVDLLRGTRSNVKLQIHDELILGVNTHEVELVDKVIHIMENAYKPVSGMKLECDAAYSFDSWNENTFKKFEGEFKREEVWV